MAILAIGDDICHPFQVCGNGGKTAQCRFQHHHAEAFHVSEDGHVGHDKEVGAAKRVLEVCLGHTPQRMDTMAEATLGGCLSNRGVLRSRPDNRVVDGLGEEWEHVPDKPC